MSNYSEEDIQVIKEDVEKIKKRPDMYIGEIKWNAFLHLIKEILQNSIDEAMVDDSNCKNITIDFDERSKKVTITDEGRGIPLGAIVDSCTIIQASGKFTKGGVRAYGFAAGKNGVGSTCVNALATEYTVISMRKGKMKKCFFEFGHLVSEEDSKCGKNDHGTLVSFIPNEKILGNITCNKNEVLELCETMSYLSKTCMTCNYTNLDGKEKIYRYEHTQGIKELLEVVCEHRLIEPVYFKYEELIGDVRREVEVCLTYTSELDKRYSEIKQSDGSIIFSFINFCTTFEHGTHVVGFRQGISNILMKYIKDKCLNKREVNMYKLIPEDIREGLVAVVNINTTENIDFGGQSKTKLKSDSILPFVKSATYNEMYKWLKDNEKEANKIADWVKAMCKARMKSSEDKQSIIKTKGFDNAFSKDKPKNWKRANGNTDLELFIIEGDSAAGGAKQTRDKDHQELFSLRGVPLNTYGMSIVNALANNEIRGLVTIIGTGTGTKCDPSKCRYKRIIMATDADSDGSKITSLLSAFFLYHMGPLVEAGLIFKVEPPLYKIENRGKSIYIKDGKEYAEYIQNFISDDITVHAIINNKEKKLTKAEVSNLIINTKSYSRLVMKCARHLLCDPVLVEYIAYLFEDIGGKKFSKLLKKKYRNLSIDNDNGIYTIYGLVNKEYQYIKLNDRNLKRIHRIYKFLLDNKFLHSEFVLEGIRTSLYNLLEVFASYEPAHKQRFKGLGEMNPNELNETTLMPENRKLIQLTTENIHEDLKMIDLLHGKSSSIREERKAMMNKFKLDLDELDT